MRCFFRFHTGHRLPHRLKLSFFLRIADALTGVAVFGATGSGKTSGPAKHLAYGYLAAGFSGLILCAKKEERRQRTERQFPLRLSTGTVQWHCQ
jgi:hypothetical protein